MPPARTRHDALLDAYNAVNLARGALDTAQCKLDIALRNLNAVIAADRLKESK
jgi:hypothetical protein